MRLRRAGDAPVPSAVATASVRAPIRSAQAPSCRQATRPSGRTSTAEPGPEPVPRGERRAVHVPALDQHPQRRAPDGGGRPCPWSAVRAGEQGEAAVEQVECRAVAPRVPDPRVRGALARPRGEVDAQVRRRVGAGDHRRAVRVAQAARQAVGRAALHVERAGGGGESDRAAFRVVAREQRVPGQAAGDPGELPAQLVAVVDRGVQADPGDRGRAVRGVADEEPGPCPIGRRDLGGQGEPLDVEHLGRQVGRAGGGAQCRRPVVRDVGPGAVEPQADVGPAPFAHGTQRAGVRLVDECEQERWVRPQCRVGPEQHLDGVGPGAEVRGGDAERGADGAARAVGPDDEPGVDARPGAELGAGTVGSDRQGDERGAEPDLAARAPHGVDEYRFEPVLRAGERQHGADVEDLAVGRVAACPAARARGRREGARRGGLGHDADPAGPHRRGDAPGAEDLHGAHVDPGGAGET